MNTHAWSTESIRLHGTCAGRAPFTLVLKYYEFMQDLVAAVAAIVVLSVLATVHSMVKKECLVDAETMRGFGRL